MAHGHSTLSEPSKKHPKLPFLSPKLLKKGRKRQETVPERPPERHRLRDVLVTAVKDTVQENFWFILSTKRCHLERGSDLSVLCTVRNISGPSRTYTVVTDRSELYTLVPSGDLVP